MAKSYRSMVVSNKGKNKKRSTPKKKKAKGKK